MSVVYFLLVVGLLVVIHELGHFVVAKLLDVKVLRFSLGYGRPLVRAQIGETEYQIGIFPLGGYVRILGVEEAGDDAPRDAGRSFASRPLWQRLCVVFAGPAANFLLTGIVYFSFFAGHRELPAAVVGDVLPDGVAARAGIEPGDRILAIDGTTVRYWEEVEQAIQAAAGREAYLRLERRGKPLEKYVLVSGDVVRRRDGRKRSQGVGITHAPFLPVVGVLDTASPAGQLGMKTGDLVVAIDGHPVDNWTDVGRRLGAGARRTSVVYLRPTPIPGVEQVRLMAPRFADLVPRVDVDERLKRTSYTGLERAEMFVARVEPGSPADSIGLRAGDLLLDLDGQPVIHWLELEQRLLAEPDRTWTIRWRRAVGDKVEVLSSSVTQVRRAQLDEYGHTVERLVFGAHNDVDRGVGQVVEIDGRIGYALSKAVERTGETMRIVVSGFFAILGGDAPSDTLGGPLMMFKVASVSGNRGWDSFWLMIALISVNLGLINLLPVPMLDGGHLLVSTIETVRGRAISERTRERVQWVGLGLVILIVLLATRNDVMRYLLR